MCRKNEDMVEEIDDCLFSLFALCCTLVIDAETALNIALSKYQMRLKKGRDWIWQLKDYFAYIYLLDAVPLWYKPYHLRTV